MSWNANSRFNAMVKTTFSYFSTWCRTSLDLWAYSVWFITVLHKFFHCSSSATNSRTSLFTSIQVLLTTKPLLLFLLLNNRRWWWETSSSDMHKVITALIPLMSVGFASTDTMVTFKVLFWVFLQSLIHMLDNCSKIPPAYGNEDAWLLWLHNRSFRFHIKVRSCNVFYLHITRNWHDKKPCKNILSFCFHMLKYKTTRPEKISALQIDYLYTYLQYPRLKTN